MIKKKIVIMESSKKEHSPIISIFIFTTYFKYMSLKSGF